MRIEIQDHQHPFSHDAGCFFILPFSSWQIQVFPTKILFSDLLGNEKDFTVDLSVKGPHADFTVLQNLDRGFVQVLSHSAQGYFRYRIEMTEKGIQFVWEKPSEEMTFSCSGKEYLAVSKESFVIPVSGYVKEGKAQEVLSLGENKKLDWNLVKRRRLLTEILPVWFRLSQIVPTVHMEETTGTAALLQKCIDVVENKKNQELLAASMNFFETAFEGVLTPRTHDYSFLGTAQLPSSHFSPIGLLSKSYQWIREMFFKETSHTWSFLSCIPEQFHAGRMIHLQSKDGDLIDFEWTKKQMRRMKIKAASSKEVVLCFPSDLTSFRLRCSPKEKGIKIEKGSPIFLKAEKIFYLDCFQK